MDDLTAAQSQPQFRWRLAKRKTEVVSVCARALLLSATALGYSAVALASPTGGEIVGGSGSISQDGSVTDINQSSQRLDINWQTFSTEVHETVNFYQPSSSAIAINRVLGGVPSYLRGALNANGQIFIINTAGVIFYQSAQVNVGALLATTAPDVAIDGDRFDFAGDGWGEVLNYGTIEISQGGFAVLAAPYVENTGYIQADLGQIHLASTNEFTLDLRGDGLITFAVARETIDAIAAEGARLGIDNSGVLQARSGTIVISANIVSDVIAGVVNLDGVVDANAFAAGLNGGTVLVDSAGDLNIGGEIYADGGVDGDGGTVITWADGVNFFEQGATISVRGGSEAGDGGFIELSGNDVRYRGTVDASAPNGAIGTMLLDPTDIVIAGGVEQADDGELAAGTPGGEASGEISFGIDNSTFTISEAAIESTNANIILEATNSITVTGTFDNDADGAGTADPGTNTVLIAGGNSLTLRTRNDTGDGTTGIDLTAGGTLSALEFKTTGAGTITIATGDDGVGGGGGATGEAPITVGILTTGTGSITIAAEGALTVSGALTTGDVTASGTPTGDIDLTTVSGDITIDAAVTTGTATVDGLLAAVTAESGEITVTAGTGGVIEGTASLVTGNATVTFAAGFDDTATVGDITLSANEVSKDGTLAFTVTLGTASSGGGTDTVGVLTVTTDGVGAAGEIRITSGSDLKLGLVSATGEGASIDIALTGVVGAALFVSQSMTTAASTTTLGDITLTTSDGNITIGLFDETIGAGEIVDVNLSAAGAVSITAGADIKTGTKNLVIGDDAVVNLTISAGTIITMVAGDNLTTRIRSTTVGAGAVLDVSITAAGDISMTGADDFKVGIKGSSIVADGAVVSANIESTGGDIALKTTTGSEEFGAGIRSTDISGAGTVVTANITAAGAVSLVNEGGVLKLGSRSITVDGGAKADAIISAAGDVDLVAASDFEFGIFESTIDTGAKVAINIESTGGNVSVESQGSFIKTGLRNTDVSGAGTIVDTNILSAGAVSVTASSEILAVIRKSTISAGADVSADITAAGDITLVAGSSSVSDFGIVNKTDISGAGTIVTANIESTGGGVSITTTGSLSVGIIDSAGTTPELSIGTGAVAEASILAAGDISLVSLNRKIKTGIRKATFSGGADVTANIVSTGGNISIVSNSEVVNAGIRNTDISDAGTKVTANIEATAGDVSIDASSDIQALIDGGSVGADTDVEMLISAGGAVSMTAGSDLSTGIRNGVSSFGANAIFDATISAGTTLTMTAGSNISTRIRSVDIEAGADVDVSFSAGGDISLTSGSGLKVGIKGGGSSTFVDGANVTANVVSTGGSVFLNTGSSQLTTGIHNADISGVGTVAEAKISAAGLVSIVGDGEVKLGFRKLVIDADAVADVTISAGGDVVIEAAVDPASGFGLIGAEDATITAGGDLVLRAGAIVGGDFTSNRANIDVFDSVLTSTGGNVEIVATSNDRSTVDVVDAEISAAGLVTLSATMGSNITTDAADATLVINADISGAGVTLNADFLVDLAGLNVVATANAVLAGENDVTIVNTSGAALEMTATAVSDAGNVIVNANLLVEAGSFGVGVDTIDFTDDDVVITVGSLAITGDVNVTAEATAAGTETAEAGLALSATNNLTVEFVTAEPQVIANDGVTDPALAVIQLTQADLNAALVDELGDPVPPPFIAQDSETFVSSIFTATAKFRWIATATIAQFVPEVIDLSLINTINVLGSLGVFSPPTAPPIPPPAPPPGAPALGELAPGGGLPLGGVSFSQVISLIRSGGSTAACVAVNCGGGLPDSDFGQTPAGVVPSGGTTDEDDDG